MNLRVAQYGESTTLSNNNGKYIMSALIYIKIAEVISQLAQYTRDDDLCMICRGNGSNPFSQALGPMAQLVSATDS